MNTLARCNLVQSHPMLHSRGVHELCLRLVLCTRKRRLRAIFVLDLFYLLLVQLGAAANISRAKSMSIAYHVQLKAVVERIDSAQSMTMACHA